MTALSESSQTCVTCKHWNRNAEDTDSLAHHAGLGICSHARHLTEVFQWDGDNDDDDFAMKLDPSAQDHGAFTMDGSDYRSTLFTRPSFGCNQWSFGDAQT